jgi:hypothetical protein
MLRTTSSPLAPSTNDGKDAATLRREGGGRTCSLGRIRRRVLLLATLLLHEVLTHQRAQDAADIAADFEDVFELLRCGHQVAFETAENGAGVGTSLRHEDDRESEHLFVF